MTAKRNDRAFYGNRNIPYLNCNGYKCLFCPKFIEPLNYTEIGRFTVCKLYLKNVYLKSFLKPAYLKYFLFLHGILTHHPSLNKKNPGHSGEIEI